MTHRVSTIESVYSGDKTLLVSHRDSHLCKQIVPNLTLWAEASAGANVGWYTRPGCKVVTRHVTIGGSDKHQKEPLLLYPVFQRDICCLHQVLFVMPMLAALIVERSRRGR